MNDVPTLMAWMWVALAAGVGVFAGALASPAPPPSVRSLLLGLAAAVAGAIGAYHLVLREYSFWSFAVAAVSAGALTSRVRNWLRERVAGPIRWGLWLGALGVAGVAFFAASHRAEVLSAAQTERERQEQSLREELAKARHVWSAEPARGVAEAVSGRLVVWLAGAPRIEVDAEYERELGSDAARAVPLRVVFLNDSFAPLDSAGEREVSISGWRLEVRDAAQSVLQAWSPQEVRDGPLLPSQRRDFGVVWSGQDGEGALAAPGPYAYVLTVETGGGTLTLELPFELVDAGPIEIVDVDPTTRYIQQQEQMMRLQKTLNEGLQRLPPLRP